MLRYPARAGEVIAATRFPEAHDRLRLPPTPGLRDWRTQMPADDVARFEAIAGPELKAHGYETAAPSPPVTVRWRAEGRVLADAAGRAGIAARAGVRVLARRPAA
jgi:hypothetical protein